VSAVAANVTTVQQPHRYFAEQAPWEDRGPDAVVPPEPVAVVVTAVFEDGWTGDVEGIAKAWTPRAVECFFRHPDPDLIGGAGYRVWVPAHRVRRLIGPGRHYNAGHQ